MSLCHVYSKCCNQAHEHRGLRPPVVSYTQRRNYSLLPRMIWQDPQCVFRQRGISFLFLRSKLLGHSTFSHSPFVRAKFNLFWTQNMTYSFFLAWITWLAAAAAITQTLGRALKCHAVTYVLRPLQSTYRAVTICVAYLVHCGPTLTSDSLTLVLIVVNQGVADFYLCL